MPRRSPRRPMPTRALRASRVLLPVRRSSGCRAVEEISAGGLVIAQGLLDTRRVALIARRNRAGRLDWCLPKGHLEGTETPEQAAVREIEEETGIRGQVIHEIGTIDYWFNQNGRRVHKTVHHYLLAATGGELSLEGDPDAEAVDVAWVPLGESMQRLTFVNERRIAQLAIDLLAEFG